MVASRSGSSARIRSDVQLCRDYTGLEIQRSLVERSEQRQHPILDTVYITDILTTDNQVFGAYGHTRIWRRTSSRRDENTGDLFRLAVEACARLRDPELAEFHPSGIIEPEHAAGTLISKAARGAGGS